jgi:hypothetical protein
VQGLHHRARHHSLPRDPGKSAFLSLSYIRFIFAYDTGKPVSVSRIFLPSITVIPAALEAALW